MSDFNPQIVQGDDIEFLLSVINTDNTPVSLEGASISYAVGAITLNLGSGLNVINGNQILVRLTNSQTLNLNAGRHKHECEITTASGYVYTVMQGYLYIKNQII